MSEPDRFALTNRAVKWPPTLGAMILGISSLGTILEIVRGLLEPAAGLRSKESPTKSSSVDRPVPARVSLLVAWETAEGPQVDSWRS